MKNFLLTLRFTGTTFFYVPVKAKSIESAKKLGDLLVQRELFMHPELIIGTVLEVELI